MKQYWLAGICVFLLMTNLAINFSIRWPQVNAAPPTGLESSVITPDDLAHALDIRWWTCEIETVPPGKTLCMAFVDQQGVVESRAAPRVKVGDRVKLVLSGFSAHNLSYSLTVGDKAYRATVFNHFNSLRGPDNWSATRRRIGEYVMKKSNSGRMVNATDDPITNHELGIIVDFFDEAQPWVRPGYLPPEGAIHTP